MSPPPLLRKLARRKWLVALAGAGCLVALGAGPALASVPASAPVPLNQPMTGEATYYNNIGTDACGGQIDPTSQDLVAISHLWFTSANPNDDPVCDGYSVQFTYNGQTFTLPIEDSCAACDQTHIDLSQAVFEQLAPLSQGVISPLTWQFVSSSGQPVSPPTQENLAVQQPPPSAPSPTPSPSTGTGTGTGAGGSCAAAWSASNSYVPGDVVSDNGDNWTSTWWSTGAEPGAPISWDVWTDNGSCS
jgi:hypothetical protein